MSSPEINRKAPTLESVFGDNLALLHALQRTRMESAVPVMMLSKPALMELPGIKSRRATCIAETLARHELAQANVYERVGDFLCRAFGSIEQAPLSALQVTSERHGNGLTRPQYRPLMLINAIARHHPYLTINDLLISSKNDLLDLATKIWHFGPRIEHAREDIADINVRLIRLNAHFEIGARHDVKVSNLHIRG